MGLNSRDASLALAVLLTLSAFSLALVVLPGYSKAVVHYVGGAGPGNFTTIQDAINASSPGDTVFVFNGTYSEHVTLGITLTLKGENRDTTIIRTLQPGDGIRVTADWVNITGFTIVNTGMGSADSGIELYYAHNCLVAGNNISSNDAESAIGVLFSHDNVIVGNIIASNRDKGVYLRLSNNNYVTNNTFQYNYRGIYLDEAVNNTIVDNVMTDDGILVTGAVVRAWNTHNITSNTVNGKPIYYWKNAIGGTVPSDAGQVILANCSGVTVEKVDIHNVFVGILLGFSDDTDIINNKIHNNHYGMLTFYSNSSRIANNEFFRNFNFHISLSRSDRNWIEGNSLSQISLDGIVLFYSNGNVVSNNTVFNSSEYGVSVFISNNNTLINNTAFDCDSGINLSGVVDSIVEGNNASYNWNGFRFTGSRNVYANNTAYSNWDVGMNVQPGSHNLILNNSFIQNYGQGLRLSGSYHRVIGNIAYLNTLDAIHLSYADFATLTNNTMIGEAIYIWDSPLEYWNTHSIDTSNTVNGKPVQYWSNRFGGTVPPGAGQVILANCDNVIVENQNISDGTSGIQIGYSHRNTILNNSVVGNKRQGIRLYYSDNNLARHNIIANTNGRGLSLTESNNNQIHHNRIINNSGQAWDDVGTNQWDDGYPSGGNYWSDYVGVDLNSGPNQDIPGSDGIGDTPYVIDADSQDDYPILNLSLVMLSRPPVLEQADLTGLNHQNVTISWQLSPDDGLGFNSIVGYRIHRNSTYDPNGLGYSLLASVPNESSEFTDAWAGEGDSSNYFYQVCAVSENNATSCADRQGGKFTRPLSNGPNLLSIPLIQSNESVETVLQTIRFDKAWTYYGWDAVDPWKCYMTFKSHKRDLERIDHRAGVWVNVTEQSNQTVAGIVPWTTSILLHRGWNLVGFPSFLIGYTALDIKMDTGTVMRIEGFDPFSPPYFLKVLQDGDMIQTGYGYWVWSVADVTWVVVAS